MVAPALRYFRLTQIDLCNTASLDRLRFPSGVKPGRSSGRWRAPCFLTDYMSITKALNLESLAFLYAFAFLIGYRLLTGRINAKGLFVSKSGPPAVRLERVHLLLNTIALTTTVRSVVFQAIDGILP